MVKQRQTDMFISLFNKSKCRDTISVNNSENNNNRVRSNSSQMQVNHDCNNNNGNVTQGTNNGSSSSKATQDQNKGNSNSSKWVINLSSHPLTPAQVSLLSKGPNFALAPVNPPNVEFISVVESACQKLLDQDVQEPRAEVNILLRRAKPPKSSISRKEKKALKELRKDQDRMVLTADKGVDLVVMDIKDYQDKIEGLLATQAYRTITTDPTNRLKVQLILKLRRIKRETNMEEGMYRSMYPTGCTAPKFYGLPKIHKQGPLLGL